MRLQITSVCSLLNHEGCLDVVWVYKIRGCASLMSMFDPLLTGLSARRARVDDGLNPLKNSQMVRHAKDRDGAVVEGKSMYLFTYTQMFERYLTHSY